jgi:hypothetical protein
MPRKSKTSLNSPLRASNNRHVQSRTASIPLFVNISQEVNQNHVHGGLDEAETSLRNISISNDVLDETETSRQAIPAVRPRRSCANYFGNGIYLQFEIV